MDTKATPGTRLSSSSIASPGLVVSRFRNMSTAIIPLPKRYSNTIWNAAKNMNRNRPQMGFPSLRLSVIAIQYMPAGSNTLAREAATPSCSVTQRAMFGSRRAAMVIKNKWCGCAHHLYMFVIVFIL